VRGLWKVCVGTGCTSSAPQYVWSSLLVVSGTPCNSSCDVHGADLCQDVEAMPGELLRRQHVTDVGNDVTVVAAATAAASTTFRRNLRLRA